MMILVVLFKQKTAYELRISDWSSGVCSSDLGGRKRQRKIGRPDELVAAGVDGLVDVAVAGHIATSVRLWNRNERIAEVLVFRIQHRDAGTQAETLERPGGRIEIEAVNACRSGVLQFAQR